MKYFRTTSETRSYKTAEEFYAFDGSTPTRQVTHIDERWLCSLDDYDPEIGLLLTDQPLQDGEFDPGEEISAEEFERAWETALRHCGQS